MRKLRLNRRNNTREFTNIVSSGSSITIPLSIFSDRTVAVLEILVEYLKDMHKLSYHEIAILINRNDRTIWTAYNRAKKKRIKKSFSKNSKFHIPVKIFSDRSVSVFEILTEYCHDSLNLKFSQIARLTDRDDRTIWTVYRRTIKKRGKI